ncbi:MAG: TIGR00269 family protein, partial [Candidatus Aenigmarchaeota archaeon]
IAIAVSGGKDSSTVMYLMHKIFHKRPDIELFAISVDEGIKGYRPASIRAARRLAKELGIRHHIYSFKEVFGKTLDQKVKELKKGSPELKEPCTYCGVGRRYILNKTARELKATKLCTGHNLDDEVQSIMMNYMRGDLFRAARMGPITDWSLTKEKGNLFIARIKPLRLIPEREAALYAILKGFGADFSECPHISGIRFEVRDFINGMEDKYSGVKYSILETFEKLLPGIRKFTSRAEGKIQLCKRCKEPGSEDICKTCKLWN